jgi:hypothetical protein
MENGRILMDGESAALTDDPRVLDAYLGRRGSGGHPHPAIEQYEANR